MKTRRSARRSSRRSRRLQRGGMRVTFDLKDNTRAKIRSVTIGGTVSPQQFGTLFRMITTIPTLEMLFQSLIRADPPNCYFEVQPGPDHVMYLNTPFGPIPIRSTLRFFVSGRDTLCAIDEEFDLKLNHPDEWKYITFDLVAQSPPVLPLPEAEVVPALVGRVDDGDVRGDVLIIPPNQYIRRNDQGDGDRFELNRSVEPHLPGNRLVRHDPSAAWMLESREIQTVCGVHLGNGVLKYVNLPDNATFQPDLNHILVPGLDGTTLFNYVRASPIGTRVIIKVNADAPRYEVLQIFSEDAVDDDACILTMYRESAHLLASYSADALAGVPAPFIPDLPEPIDGRPHYTSNTLLDERELKTLTIDGRGARDLDDALSVDVERRILYVHIVDIAGGGITKVDEHRLKVRSETLYLGRIAERLLTDTTAGRLTLDEEAERHVITVKMLINAIGGVSHYAIYPSTIKSKKKMTYAEVATILGAPRNDWIGSTIQFLDTLAKMSEHTKAQLVPEVTNFTGYKPKLGANDAANKLVEIAMIWANITVASHLRMKGVRIPNIVYTTTAVTSTVYDNAGNPIIDASTGQPQTISRVVFGARYDADRRGHESVEVPDYTHFTSPMRRDADATVHKILAGQFDDALLDTRIKRINHRNSFNNRLEDLSKAWTWLRNDRRNVYRVKIMAAGRWGAIWSYQDNGIRVIKTASPGEIVQQRGVYIQKGMFADLIITAITNLTAFEYTVQLSNYRT